MQLHHARSVGAVVLLLSLVCVLLVELLLRLHCHMSVCCDTQAASCALIAAGLG